MSVNFAGMKNEAEQAWTDFEDLCGAIDRNPSAILPRAALTLVCDADALAHGAAPARGALGLRPYGDDADERFDMLRSDDGFEIRACGTLGIYRALCSLLWAEAERIPAHFGDGPVFAYRALSLDVARYRASAATIERVIDLLAVHRMSALHLHLTDHQSWRVPLRGFDNISGLPDVLTDKELNHIKEHAQLRHIALIPEIDLPGHCAAMLSVYPELASQEFASPMLAYISPEAPRTEEFLDSCADALCALATGRYVHIGGDEVFGMPADAYTVIVDSLIEKIRLRGKKAIAWQEASRSHESADAYQYWMADEDIPTQEDLALSWPEKFKPFAKRAADMYAQCHDDPRRFRDKDAWVIDSRQSLLYLDRKYRDPSLSQQQNERMATLGFPNYTPTDTLDVLRWTPLEGMKRAGIEAAVWTETVNQDDDIATLLLPRLMLVADLAWRGRPGNPRELPLERGIDLWKRLGFGAYYESTSLFG